MSAVVPLINLFSTASAVKEPGHLSLVLIKAYFIITQMIIYFLTGLCFGGLGLAAYLQSRQAGDFPLRKHLPYLATFGFVHGVTSWIEMSIASGVSDQITDILNILLIIGRPMTGLLLFRFGWGIFKGLSPLPPWMVFIPGIMIIPIAFAITYSSTTFITPSPIEIPIDIWSRYLLYLPGSILAGIGFLRHWNYQKKLGSKVVAQLMLGAGLGFMLEAFVVGLIVPAAPYGPASYYNYDRATHNAFIGEVTTKSEGFGLTRWLDYQQVLEVTGLPIEFWRLVSAVFVTSFVIKGLDVFEEIRKRNEAKLVEERDTAQIAVIESEIKARENAEHWTDVLVNINQQITNFENLDSILLNIITHTRVLFNSDSVGLALWDNTENQLAIKCYAIPDKSEMVTSTRAVENAVLLYSFETSRPYYSKEDDSDSDIATASPPLAQPAKQVAVVPIKLVDNSAIGVLWMCRDNDIAYNETDLIWLECMADQVMIAIQHGIMTGQLQSLSIIEERGRIAREMHDGLAQVLGYLNLQLHTLNVLQKQGKQAELEEELTQMNHYVQVAQADIRENILSLRTTLANEKGMVISIEEYLEEFSLQTGIQVDFNNSVEDELHLTSLGEVQLVCILQEALTNVRKHAEAQKVSVALSMLKNGRDEKVVLQIIDDGKGFDMKERSKHFGLQTMRERAQSVNADFTVYSNLGNGTQIECVFPCVEPSTKGISSILLNE